eukprot:scaffold179707_cov34-Tisochrysis_lutea.AAC.8
MLREKGCAKERRGREGPRRLLNETEYSEKRRRMGRRERDSVRVREISGQRECVVARGRRGKTKVGSRSLSRARLQTRKCSR